MKNIKQQAFTLVELIVVITILAVLGTIAVISLQSYTINARDSVRVYDLKNIKSAIEYARIEQGKYILPDNGVNITYSGSVVVWTQGTFGKQARRTIKRRLDKVPVDPLTQDEYTFSVTANKSEYELGAIMEGDDLVQTTPNILNSTYAATSYRAYVTGTYNGKIAKAYSGSTLYIFALPSIISTNPTNPDIEYQITNKQLVMKGYKNLPSSYNNQNNGVIPAEVDFVNPNKLVVFSGSIDSLKTDNTEQITLISNLQQAYSGTSIQNNSEISQLLEVDTTTNPEGTQFLAQTLIQSSLDRRFSITAQSTTNPSGPDYSNCLSMTQDNVDNLNNTFNKIFTKVEWCNTTYLNHKSGLPKIIPSEIGFLTNLTYLQLAKIQGPTLPIEIGNLVNLTALDIASNQLETLPIEIGNLVNLTSLNMSGNLLQTLPIEIGNLVNLIYLHIDNNQFTSLPAEIGNLINLTDLRLSNNQLTSLPSEIGNLINLTSLDGIGNTGLGILNSNFTAWINIVKCQSNIPTVGKTMCIVGNGTTIDITINTNL